MAGEPDASGAEQHATQEANPAVTTATDTAIHADGSSPSTSAQDTTGQSSSANGLSPPHNDGSSSFYSQPSNQGPADAPVPDSSDRDAAPLPVTSDRPATDMPIVAGPSGGSPAGGDAAGTSLNILLMLASGARHPYRIDEKYLLSRKVVTTSPTDGRFDPRELSGYQLKELIWHDWRREWEPRPASPSGIRLIIMGKMLEDKAPLREYPFSLEQPNVVHIAVKPADLVDDEETGGKAAAKGRGRDEEEQGAGCRCVIL